MDSEEIDKIIASTKAGLYYRGCRPSDQLQLPFKYPSAYVVNEDPKGLPGTHWVAIFLKNPREAYYFDSFGREPLDRIQQFLSNYEKIVKNHKIFQSPLSNTCGLYAIYFLIHMSKGNSFDSLIKTLNSAPNTDFYIQRYFKPLYTIKE